MVSIKENGGIKADAEGPTKEFRPQYKRVIKFIGWIKRMRILTKLLKLGWPHRSLVLGVLLWHNFCQNVKT